MEMLMRGMKAQVWISKPEVRRQGAQAQVPARYFVFGSGLLGWCSSGDGGVLEEEEGTGRRYHFSWFGLDTVSGGVVM
jgi:hypothetical protein